MTPAEAVFVTGFLLRSKAVDPDYQMDPNEWVKEQKARKPNPPFRSREATVSSPRAYLAPANTDASRLLSYIMFQLNREGTESTVQAHKFLDRLGLGR